MKRQTEDSAPQSMPAAKRVRWSRKVTANNQQDTAARSIATTASASPGRSKETAAIMVAAAREASKTANMAAKAAADALKGLEAMLATQASIGVDAVPVDLAGEINESLESASRRTEGVLSIIYLDQHDNLGIAGSPFSPATASKLVQASTKSSFTIAGNPVYNEGYRRAYEIAPPKLLLIADPAENIVSEMREYLSESVLERVDLSATILKLNAYLPNGHFEWHTDRKRGDNHIGTLVVCLPSQFAGGELVLRLEEGERVHNWAPRSSQADLGWVYIPLGVEHKVQPVTDGIRLTLQYAIYASEIVHPEPVPAAVVAKPATRPTKAPKATSASIRPVKRGMRD